MSVPIRDSRTMHGAYDRTTPAEVRAAWHEFATRSVRQRGGFANRPGAVGLESAGTAQAYVSDNRWVAECPACKGGIAVWEEMEDACCYDCGRVVDVEFPPAQELRQAVAVLERRPPENRHWRPDRGETVDDLRAENALRGFNFATGGA